MDRTLKTKRRIEEIRRTWQTRTYYGNLAYSDQSVRELFEIIDRMTPVVDAAMRYIGSFGQASAEERLKDAVLVYRSGEGLSDG